MMYLGNRSEHTRVIDIMSLAAHIFPEIGTDLERMWWILWEKSAYPCTDDLDHFRQGWERLKHTWDMGWRDCDLCPEPAIPNGDLCPCCEQWHRSH